MNGSDRVPALIVALSGGSFPRKTGDDLLPDYECDVPGWGDDIVFTAEEVADAALMALAGAQLGSKMGRRKPS